MAYFVTGATGFIGRHLVERLLDTREGDIFVLVREGSRDRMESRIAAWGAQERVGSSPATSARRCSGCPRRGSTQHRGKIEHFFHLAAIYDMTVSDERNEVLNVGGTRHAVALGNALEAGTFHHVSSVAVAGDFKGLFREDMFNEGQGLPSAYHRTKFESEKVARESLKVPWRVYRPAIVVGHSRTGQMDKVDGPYYFFKAIQKARAALPEWFPLVGPELGRTNVVPVDYVADALDHIAHEPGLDGQTFHLAQPAHAALGRGPQHLRAGRARAPARAARRQAADRRAAQGRLLDAHEAPGPQGRAQDAPGRRGHPRRGHRARRASAPSSTPATPSARSPARASRSPSSTSTPGALWDYWERHLDPDLFRDRSFEGAINGRTVVITGASSGIGLAAAHKIAAAGGIPILVARSMDKLEAAKAEIEAAGGTAYAYSADLSDLDAIDALVERLLSDHVAIDMLVNNAGRSIRRSVSLSLDRFHDYERTMQLNYFGAIKLVMGFLPHWKERGSGHVVNVSSIGAQTNPPRFSAYVASKAALDAWTRVVSSEVIGDGITFTTIHMPLVRTPMIAPTKMYDSFPTITPDEAGDLVCEAIRSKPKQINTRLGTFGEVAYTLAPKAVDQILHMAYRVFPDSAAAKGQKDPNEKASMEQVAMANLMKGVHW